jgi:hypothetical protein
MAPAAAFLFGGRMAALESDELGLNPEERASLESRHTRRGQARRDALG